MTLTSRNKRIFNYINDSVDAIIITTATDPFIDEHFFYVSGLHHGLFEHSTAVIYPDGNGALIVTSLEEESAKKSDLAVHSFQTTNEHQAYLKELLSSCDRIGFNAQEMLYNDYQKLIEQHQDKTFIDVSVALHQARMKKDKEEITLIQKACDIAVQTLKDIPTMITNGMTEHELAAEINHTLQKKGADAPAFETIASFGEHTAQPHYTHGEKRLRKADFILCDFGARYHHYHSDITRTFVHQEATSKQKHIHHVVCQAQQQAIQHIKPGIIASDIHQLTKQYIDNSEYSGRFIHSTGHSLGLRVHDVGVGLSDHGNTALEEGMVFTVEPGIYIPEIGGVRIEDDIYITSDGCKILTDAPRELQIV